MSNEAIEECAALVFLAGIACFAVVFGMAETPTQQIVWSLVAIAALIASLTLIAAIGVSYLEEIARGAKAARLKREATEAAQKEIR